MNVQHKPHKPLHVNPIAHSQPMGATLAFLGVKDCLPLMHGAQGCASFTKVLFTRHFSEPIAIQNTAVSDITAVLDGGDYSILTAIENVTKKAKPSLIGLHTTGLTETKGDDIRGAVSRTDYPTVFVNTGVMRSTPSSVAFCTTKSMRSPREMPCTRWIFSGDSAVFLTASWTSSVARSRAILLIVADHSPSSALKACTVSPARRRRTRPR